MHDHPNSSSGVNNVIYYIKICQICHTYYLSFFLARGNCQVKNPPEQSNPFEQTSTALSFWKRCFKSIMINSILNILCEYVSIIFVLKTVVIVNMILNCPLANPYLILWLLSLLYNQYQPIMSEAYLTHTCHQTCYECCWRIFGHLGLSAWKIQLREFC